MVLDGGSRSIQRLACLLGFVLAAGAGAHAEAQRRPRREEAPAAVSPELAAAVAQLASSDEAVIQQGIEALGLAGTPDVVEPLAARIRRGLPPELLEMAVDTLIITGQASAGPVLITLVAHRRPEIRLKAVQGIASIKPRGAEQSLTLALGDSDPQVRAAAAVGLGAVGARGSVDQLFLALEHGVLEASTSIGQLATPAEAMRLLGYLGRLAFDAISPGLGELLARADLPDRTKLDLIARLAELATGGTKTFLQEFVAALPPTDRGPVRRAAEDAAMRIAD
jgi:hypothetical protein